MKVSEYFCIIKLQFLSFQIDKRASFTEKRYVFLYNYYEAILRLPCMP